MKIIWWRQSHRSVLTETFSLLARDLASRTTYEGSTFSIMSLEDLLSISLSSYPYPWKLTSYF